MENITMLVGMSGDLEKCKSHLSEKFLLPVAAYKSAHGVANSTVLSLMLSTNANPADDSFSYFKVLSDDSLVAISEDDFNVLFAEALEDNGTLYNRDLSIRLKFPRYVVRIK